VTPTGSVGGDERLRLFLGLRLPDDVLDRIEQWQNEHLSGRIVPRTNLHITLAFLGSRPAVEVSQLAEVLGEATRSAGEIELSARRYRETRSVGMVVLEDRAGEGGLLATRVFDGLEAIGVYRREQRPWLPHVTVLRFRSAPKLQPPVPELEAFSPSDAAVFISRLRPSGAQYDVLESVPLGGD
jgi:RNA 2',3'-cyclic 3'-phosphodiesterase